MTPANKPPRTELIRPTGRYRIFADVLDFWWAMRTLLVSGVAEMGDLIPISEVGHRS
jgi:hypothetical protein